MRPLFAYEIPLMQALLDFGRRTETPDSLLIEPLADGQTGSFRIGEDIDSRSFGRSISEVRFNDEDGVSVSAVLNVDTNGRLFEVDLWKVDFAPLLRWPQRQDMKSAQDVAPGERVSKPQLMSKVEPCIESWAVAFFALIAFGCALLSEAIILQDHDPMLGYQVLLYGWLGPLAGGFAWYANPALVAGVVLYARGHFGWALAFTLVAALLAATSPLMKEVWFNEAVGTKILGLGVGFTLWCSAIAIFGAAVVSAIFQGRGDDV